MPSAPRKPCSTVGCGELVAPGTTKCADHARASDKARGTSTQRGYGKAHRLRFREGVLARHPICVICHAAPSTVADHYPISKRELDSLGMDSNDPHYGRGVCHTCHMSATAQTDRQRGGWNAPQ